MKYRNLAEMHQAQAERLGPRTALRYKRNGLWHDVSAEKYRADALACAAALIDAGVRAGDRVGLLSENRVEWLIADMGILAAAAVNVPPHAPLTARQVHFQLADTEACWVFVSNREQLEKIKQVRSELPALRGVVVFDGGCEPDAISWTTFLQKGRQALPHVAAEQARRQAELGPDDLATIMYTSGTTGNPKGVMLTHGNLLSNMQGCLEASPHEPGSVLLSWLPYSHIYARMCDHYVSTGGGTVVYLAESPESVVQNIAETAPTHLTAVPRFYEKVLAAVSGGDREAMKKRLRFLFGPRIDWLSSGGAPLAKPFAEAFDQAGLLLFQGYGLTESSPVITFNRKTANKIGTVGKPIPGVEVKIAPDGEVLTRGPHVMKGYWKNPAATAEAIRDGWLHTGDLGSLDEEGYLTITGRKKELLVLSNGKKMVPSVTEGELAANPFIDQTLVFGEGKPYLGALVAPKWDNVIRALKSRCVNLETECREKLCGHPAVRELLQRAIDEAQADLANWEQVRKFIVVPEFSLAGGDLTVSLKMRRDVVLKKYAAAIAQLYQD